MFDDEIVFNASAFIRGKNLSSDSDLITKKKKKNGLVMYVPRPIYIPFVLSLYFIITPDNCFECGK